MKTKWSAAVLTVTLLAAACSPDSNTNDSPPEPATETGAADALVAQLTDELNESSAELAIGKANIEELERQIGELEDRRVELADSLAGSGEELSAAREEATRLRLAFAGELVAATVQLRSRALSAACALGATDADAGSTRRADLAPRVAEAAATTPLEAEQFGFVIEAALENLELGAEWIRCNDSRLAEVAEERLIAERAAMATLLPAICDYYRQDGRYLTVFGGAGRTYELADYVSLVVSGLPDGWEGSPAVTEESARCDALLLVVHGGGTRLVGQDIAAGTYRSVEAVDDACYWERTRPDGEIIDNQFTQSAAQITVRVSSSDYSIENDGCGLLISEPLRAELD